MWFLCCFEFAYSQVRVPHVLLTQWSVWTQFLLISKARGRTSFLFQNVLLTGHTSPLPLSSSPLASFVCQIGCSPVVVLPIFLKTLFLCPRVSVPVRWMPFPVPATFIHNFDVFVAWNFFISLQGMLICSGGKNPSTHEKFRFDVIFPKADGIFRFLISQALAVSGTCELPEHSTGSEVLTQDFAFLKNQYSV